LYEYILGDLYYERKISEDVFGTLTLIFRAAFEESVEHHIVGSLKGTGWNGDRRKRLTRSKQPAFSHPDRVTEPFPR